MTGSIRAIGSHFALACWYAAEKDNDEHARQEYARILQADGDREVVELSFTGCSLFSDQQLHNLITHLPPCLRVLRLDLAFTGLHTLHCLEALREMTTIVKLSLSFTGSRNLCNIDGLGLGLQGMPQLRELELCFLKLLQLVDISALVLALPCLNLSQLDLTVDSCPRLMPCSVLEIEKVANRLKWRRRTRTSLTLQARAPDAQISSFWPVCGCASHGRKPMDHMDHYNLKSPEDLIALLEEADIRLVRGKFLLELHQKSETMIRRQELETQHGHVALVSQEELRDWGAGRIRPQICSVSHCWESREHPDPFGYQLAILAAHIHAADWFFIDYMSLYQYGRRTDEQYRCFQLAMKHMHVLYAHEFTSTLRIEDLTPEDVQERMASKMVTIYYEPTDSVQPVLVTELKANATSYFDRGWCQAEVQWSLSRSLPASSYRIPQRPHHELNGRAPMAPKTFQERVEAKTFKFTHRQWSDRCLGIARERFPGKSRCVWRTGGGKASGNGIPNTCDRVALLHLSGASCGATKWDGLGWSKGSCRGNPGEQDAEDTNFCTQFNLRRWLFVFGWRSQDQPHAAMVLFWGPNYWGTATSSFSRSTGNEPRTLRHVLRHDL